MTSKTDLTNEAFALVGVERITSFDSSAGRPAVIARDVFDVTFQSVLRAHNWNFNDCMKQLSDTGVTPTMGWEYAYNLPDDYLRCMSVHGSDDLNDFIDYKLGYMSVNGTNQRVVYCDEDDPVYMRFGCVISDLNVVPPDVQSTISHLLAVKVGLGLKRPAAQMAELKKAYKEQLTFARSVDGIEDSAPRQRLPSWASVRSGFNAW